MYICVIVPVYWFGYATILLLIKTVINSKSTKTRGETDHPETVHFRCLKIKQLPSGRLPPKCARVNTTLRVLFTVDATSVDRGGTALDAKELPKTMSSHYFGQVNPILPSCSKVTVINHNCPNQ